MVMMMMKRLYPFKVAQTAIFSVLLFGKSVDMEMLQSIADNELKKRLKKSNLFPWASWITPWRRNSSPSSDINHPSTSSSSSSSDQSDDHHITDHPDTSSSSSLTLSLPHNNTSATSQVTNTLLSLSTPAILSKSTSSAASLLLQTSKVKVRKVKTIRSLRPTSEQIAMMKLKPGANKVAFHVNTEFRGKQTVISTIYLWSSTAKVVISDIDGTITRSDMMGHVLPMLGKDWSHSGVAQLFSTIRAHGYHLVYLTSRPIGQAQTTRNFINNLKQGLLSSPFSPSSLPPYLSLYLIIIIIFI